MARTFEKWTVSDGQKVQHNKTGRFGIVKGNHQNLSWIAVIWDGNKRASQTMAEHMRKV